MAPHGITNKLNKRKRLLRQSKLNNVNVNCAEIRTLKKKLKISLKVLRLVASVGWDLGLVLTWGKL